MGIDSELTFPRDRADWIYRSLADFGSVDSFDVHLLIGATLPSNTRSSSEGIRWHRRTTVSTPELHFVDGSHRASSAELCVAIGVTDASHEGYEKWLDAADNAGKKLIGSQVGHLALPADYEDAENPSEACCILEGAARWIYAMHQHCMNSFSWRGSELSWTCTTPVTSSRRLAEYIMSCCLSTPDPKAELPSVTPAKRVPLDGDDVAFLKAALQLKADAMIVKSNVVYRAAFPNSDGHCPRSLRERLGPKGLHLLETHNGRGVMLTDNGVQTAKSQCAH